MVEEIALTLCLLGVEERDAVEAALLASAKYGETFPLQHQVMGCRDAEDDHLYELALLGGAEVIISRDDKVLNPPLHVAAYLESHGIALMPPVRFVEAVLGSKVP
jgi:predicted nucleic acid-binding protein